MYYRSSRCYCVTRFVTAAEVSALIHAVRMGMILPDALNELLNQSVEMKAFVDRRTMFNVVAKNGNTTESRMLINIIALRERYKNG